MNKECTWRKQPWNREDKSQRQPDSNESEQLKGMIWNEPTHGQPMWENIVGTRDQKVAHYKILAICLRDLCENSVWKFQRCKVTQIWTTLPSHMLFLPNFWHSCHKLKQSIVFCLKHSFYLTQQNLKDLNLYDNQFGRISRKSCYAT